MSSSLQGTDSANTPTNRRSGRARVVNAVSGNFANLARRANLRLRHPKQHYVRDGNLLNESNVEREVKRSRVVPDRIALLVPTRLDMLDVTLAEDRDPALGRAARIAAGDEA